MYAKLDFLLQNFHRVVRTRVDKVIEVNFLGKERWRPPGLINQVGNPRHHTKFCLKKKLFMRMTKKVMNATKTKRFVDLTLRPVGTTVVGVRIEAVQVRILSCKKLIKKRYSNSATSTFVLDVEQLRLVDDKPDLPTLVVGLSLNGTVMEYKTISISPGWMASLT